MVILLDGTFSNNLLEFTAVQVGLLSRSVHSTFFCQSITTENLRKLFLNDPKLIGLVQEFTNIILIRRMWVTSLQEIFPNKKFHIFQNIFGYTNEIRKPSENSFNSTCKLPCCSPSAPTIDDSHSNVTIQKFAVFITERIFAPEVFASLLCYNGGASSNSSYSSLPPPLNTNPFVAARPTAPKQRSPSTTESWMARCGADFSNIDSTNCAKTLDELIGMIDSLQKEDLEGHLGNSPMPMLNSENGPNSNLAGELLSPYSPISPVNPRYVSSTVDEESVHGEPLDLRFSSSSR